MHGTASELGAVALALHSARELTDLLSVTVGLASGFFGCEQVAVARLGRQSDLLVVIGPAAAQVEQEAAADASAWRRAAEEGLPVCVDGPRAVTHVPLVPGRGRAVGVLSLYWQDTLPELDGLRPFAMHVAVAMETLWYQNRLHESMETHRLVSLGLGILMERYGIDSKAAYDVLSRASLEHQIKLRDIAQQLIEDKSLPEPV